VEGDLEPKLEHYGTSKESHKKKQEDFKLQFKGSYYGSHHIKWHGKKEEEEVKSYILWIKLTTYWGATSRLKGCRKLAEIAHLCWKMK
jgi:hypothetical protein